MLELLKLSGPENVANDVVIFSGDFGDLLAAFLQILLHMMEQ